MAITAATLAAAAAPAVFNIAANFLRGPRKTAYEREMRGMARHFKEQANTPYLQTEEGASQIQQAERIDKRNRRRTAGNIARSGATGETEIATTQANNEVHAGNVNRIAGRGGQYKQRMLSNYMSAAGAAENARLNSEQMYQNQIGAITEGIGGAANAFILSDIYKPKT